MMVPEDEKKFEMPEGLAVPPDVQLPATMKLHYLIEKTAAFISKHGLQMEILIKAKQANNPQFEFLSFDSLLNPYYKLLVSSIRSGSYVPQDDKADETDSDDDDHYLHPSLLGNSKNAKSTSNSFNLPKLPRSIDENNAYSQLVKSIKQKVGDFGDDQNHCDNDQSNTSLDNTNINVINCANTVAESDQQSMSILPPPPPEVEKIIEKLAQYVAKNGQDFEQTIKQRNESRFEFINPGNVYHGYYIKRKLYFLEERRKQQAEEIMAKNSKANGDASKTSDSKTQISFTLKEKKKSIIDGALSSEEKSKAGSESDDGSNSCKSDDDLGLEELLADSPKCKESTSKEKQEERKRKAALFLNYLKQKQAADSEQSACDTSSIHPSSHNSESHQNHLVHSSTSLSRLSPDSAVSDDVRKKLSNESSRTSTLLPFIHTKDSHKDCLLEKNRDKSKSPDSSNQKHSHSHKHRRHKHRSSRTSHSHKKSKKSRSSSSGMYCIKS